MKKKIVFRNEKKKNNVTSLLNHILNNLNEK